MYEAAVLQKHHSSALKQCVPLAGLEVVHMATVTREQPPASTAPLETPVHSHDNAATAFRAIEKFYKLHKPQGRQRRGRAAAHLAVDLSSALDFQRPQQVDHWLAEGLLHRHTVPTTVPFTSSQLTASIVTNVTELPSFQPELQQPTACDGHITAYTMPQHPGLLVVPGALNAAQQLALAQASFLHFPEPPARTNHDREYGPLTGVWTAAQQGLLLKVPKKQHVSPHTQPYPHQAPDTEPDTAASDAHTQHATAEDDEAQADMYNNNSSSEQPNTSGTPQDTTQATPQGTTQVTAQDTTQATAQATAQGTHAAPPVSGQHPSPEPSTTPGTVAQASHSDPITPAGGSWHQPAFHECWSSPDSHPDSRTATKATSMLKRMRWAVLGPHYDWTKRLYVRDEPHRRLPPGLVALATHWGRVAHQLTSPASCTCDTARSSAHTCTAQEHTCRRSYVPDGALVNFYYEGDTLMGHCDDVEADLSQPIVAVSVGCDAVFLMGGTTKTTPPTAIIVRSGDVVVLSGAARRSYHGVPRVLTHHPLPECLAQHVSSLTGEEQAELQPFLSHLATCRINISIRAVC